MLLLDTCALVWLVDDQAKFSAAALQAIKSNSGNVFISAISALELGIKINKNLLELPLSLSEWLQEAKQSHFLKEIAINSVIAILASELPPLHRDPADRLIIATAIQNNLAILTPDKHIHAYPNVKVIW